MIDKMVIVPKNYAVEFKNNTFRVIRDVYGVYGLSFDEALKLAEKKCIEYNK